MRFLVGIITLDLCAEFLDALLNLGLTDLYFSASVHEDAHHLILRHPLAKVYVNLLMPVFLQKIHGVWRIPGRQKPAFSPRL